MKLYAVANPENRSGKTTSVVSIAGALAKEGLSVLIIDLDPTCSLSNWVATPSKSATALVSGRFGSVLGERISSTTHGDHIDVVAADRSLEEKRGTEDKKVEERLRRFWEATVAYEYGLIDTPSSSDALSTGALRACDSALVPIRATSGAVGRLTEVMQLINSVGPASMCGAFACRVEVKSIYSTHVPLTLRRKVGLINQGGGAFQTYIRETPSVRAAFTAGEFPGSHDKTMKAVMDYSNLVSELINNKD